MESRKLLILSAPRSGTRYAARICSKLGLNVQHERVGAGGTVSSYFVVDDYWYQGAHSRNRHERRSEFKFDHVWHQVRHPLNVIGSMFGHNVLLRNWWHWQEKHTGISFDSPPLVRAARFWIDWNEKIGAQNPDIRYRIEDIEFVWPELMERLGMQGTDLPPVDKKTNSRPHEPVTWRDLQIEDRDLSDRVKRIAEKYGYRTVD